MKRAIKFCFICLLFIGVVGLSGCANMSAPPTCPDGTGLSCARVDQINTMVDRGQLSVTPIGRSSRGNAGPFQNFSIPYPSTVKSGQPLWNGEKVMQVWVAPFKDSSGNYHQASLIDTVVKPGYWIGNPPKSLTNEQG